MVLKRKDKKDFNELVATGHFQKCTVVITQPLNYGVFQLVIFVRIQNKTRSINI